jgi:hypothetical protein
MMCERLIVVSEGVFQKLFGDFKKRNGQKSFILNLNFLATSWIGGRKSCITFFSNSFCKMSKEEPEPWHYSQAKQMLTKDILDGIITSESDEHLVFLSRAEYQIYNEAKFTRNLKSLLTSLNAKQTNAAFDATAVAHDINLFPRPMLSSNGYPFWDTSEAKQLLLCDINNNVDLTMTKEAFHQSREAYKLFPFKVFNKHINQERSQRLQRSYWQFKKDETKRIKEEQRQKKRKNALLKK